MQVPSGRIKDILKLDMQNLIYLAKYTNLQTEIGSGSNQKFGMVPSFNVFNVSNESRTPTTINR